jgi:hypothetical protein
VDVFIDVVNSAPKLYTSTTTEEEWRRINEGWRQKSTHEIITG